MARLNGILTKLQGSVGSFTFKQNGGQTVVSEKITQTTNAKTNGQQKQRMKWTNVIRMYQVLTPYLKLAFGGARNGRSDYNKFVSANLGKAPVYLTKQEAQAGASIVAPYEVTHGSIKSIKINGKGNQAVTDISLGDLTITDETTVKEFLLIFWTNFIRTLIRHCSPSQYRSALCRHSDGDMVFVSTW